MKITRENVGEIAIKEAAKNKTLLLELPTGFGKSKIAIDIINSIKSGILLANKIHDLARKPRILLFVAKIVHKQTWIDEINKWGGLGDVDLTIECYESMHKYKGAQCDILIGDEFHHIGSSQRLEVLRTINVRRLLIGLSATLSKDLKEYFSTSFWGYDAKILTLSLQKAIDNDVLPEPEVHLVKLLLGSHLKNQTIVLNPKLSDSTIIECDYENRLKYLHHKRNKIIIHCTEVQKNNWYNYEIEKLKERNARQPAPYNRNYWMRMCLNRLHWLAELKNDYILELLKKLKDKRVLTFCGSVAQTEILGSNCINSKNKHSQQILVDFNEGRINHITTCNILNESVNLVNCEYGIFANINASKTMQRQRVGRILRHKKPIIIIPYYVNTREEELVKDMIAEYDSKYIKVL